jgi:hypothetical protein
MQYIKFNLGFMLNDKLKLISMVINKIINIMKNNTEKFTEAKQGGASSTPLKLPIPKIEPIKLVEKPKSK